MSKKLTGVSWSLATFAVIAIGLRFASLTLYTVISPYAILAIVLWAVTISQIVARFIDFGLPSLIRNAGHYRVVKRAVLSWRVWVLYGLFISIGSVSAISLISALSWGGDMSVPLWMMVMYSTSVALNNIILQLQFGGGNVLRIALTLLVPPLAPLMIGGCILILRGNALDVASHLFLAYISGDIVLSTCFLLFLIRGRCECASSMRLNFLWRSVKWRNISRFLISAWLAGLVKTLGQKAERVLSIALLSAEAYVTVNYLLAMRDALANVSGLAVYRYYNKILFSQKDAISARLYVWIWPMLFAVTMSILVLWYFLSILIDRLPITPFESSAPLIAILIAAIIPFIYLNIIAQMSTAMGSQRVNMNYQIVLIISITASQELANLSGWTPFIGLGPFLAALIIGLYRIHYCQN